MIELGVNIDHVATLRQARRTHEPDPVWAAVEAHLGGADGITVHLREDRRHIQDEDVRRLRELTHIKLNLEMAATAEMLDIATRLAGRATKLQLEMGGKNPLVVLADADLPKAVEWLTAQGVKVRTDDPIFLAATQRWFERLLPVFVERQIDRGGPIILCQIENEHWASGVYGHDAHQMTLARLQHDAGLTVPFYTCMGGLDGYPEFRNGWSGMAAKLQATRAAWPDNPVIVSELWSGWFDSWGASAHNGKTANSLDRMLHELIAVGCSGVSHWVFAGGTNFGWYGGRTVGSDTIHMTTSYDYDAPITEYGQLTEKFFVARRHHLFLSTLGTEVSRLLADAKSGGPTVIVPPRAPSMVTVPERSCWFEGMTAYPGVPLSCPTFESEMRFEMGMQCAVCGKKPSLGHQITRRGKAKYLGGVGIKITDRARKGDIVYKIVP